MKKLVWKPVVCAADCPDCEACGEPVCPTCGVHYVECSCPGPTQDDEYEYMVIDGKMMARPIDN